MSKFMCKRYSSLETYVPGEQPKDKRYVKLNTNESPFPPSPEVINAITSKEIEDLRLYSDPECSALIGKIASLYGVGSENVFLSNGSDDILNFAFMAFAADAKAVFPDISYGFYPVYANLHNVDSKKIPLKEDFSICTSDYFGAEGLVVIANPNAPTGLALSVADIEQILINNPNSVVLIDEAYVDFGAESCFRLIDKYDNLLVVQTFSKSRSLAGARLGFAIASAAIIADLNKIKYSTNPYNVNRLSLKAGEAAIDSNDYYMQNCKRIIEFRAYMTQELEALGFYVIPSKANFVFAKLDGYDGEYIYSELKKRGVLVRHFTSERIKDFNRITVGTKEEIDVLITALKEIIDLRA